MNAKKVFYSTVLSILFFIVLYFVSRKDFFLRKAGYELNTIQVIFISLIPFIILLILSGKLKEFRGPGGIGVTLNDFLKKPLSPDILNEPLKIEQDIVLDKDSEEKLEERLKYQLPTTLSLKILSEQHYDYLVLELYIKLLSRNPYFRNIIFVNEGNRFKGFIKVSDFLLLMNKVNIIEIIKSGEILSNEFVITNHVSLSTTYKQILSEMDRNNIDVIPVVDEIDGKFIGVVEQDEIMRKILSNVIKEL